MVFYSPKSTKPKNLRDQISYHALPHASRDIGVHNLSFMHQHMPPHQVTRWHAPCSITSTRAIRVHVPSSTMTSLMMSSPLPEFDLDPLGNLTRSSWPSPNRWKKKKKALSKLAFDFDQKVKIFKRGLSHSVFHIHFNFGICFSVRDSGIVQTIKFPKKLTFVQILTKIQNFQEGLVLPNFLHRFRFWDLFLHLRIQNCSNSVVLQLLALMWTLTKNQDVRTKLVLFRFSHRF